MSEFSSWSPFWQRWHLRAVRLGIWLRDHPVKTLIIAVLWLVFVFTPAFISDVWGLFSDKPFVPSMIELLHTAQMPQFSAYWITVPIGFLMLAIIVALLVMARRTESGGIQIQGTGTVSAPETSVHVECEKKIARLLDSEHTHALRADSSEARFEQFKAEYAVPIEIANHQLTRIGEFVEIVRACTHDVRLDDDLPTIRWGLRILNHSVFRIQLDGKVGPLFFEGRKLTQPKELVENTTLGLPPYREGSLIFEQQLSLPECEMLRRRPDGQFQFDQVLLHFKGHNDERVKSGRLIIPSEFRARLGRCSDIKTQATESLQTQINQLTDQLGQVNEAKNAERRQLINNWRLMIATALRQYMGPEALDYSFTDMLARQDGYVSLLPYLSEQAKVQLEIARDSKAVDVNRLVDTLAKEVVRMEHEWKL